MSGDLKKITELTTGTPKSTDVMIYVENPTTKPVTKNAYPFLAKNITNGRLTLASGNPFPSTDQADKTTLYFTPCNGNEISLYDGSAWKILTFTELSLDISAYTASKPYDIWAYENSGVVALDSTIWTDGNTRATALVYQDGVYVKSGATTRKYLGTIYMDAAQKCQDTETKAFVWNYYNRQAYQMRYKNDATSHTYTGATAYRYFNNDSTNKLEFIIGVMDDSYNANIIGQFRISSTTYNASIGVGLNTDSSAIGGLRVLTTVATLMQMGSSLTKEWTLVGYNYLSMIETINNASATGTFGQGVITVYHRC